MGCQSWVRVVRMIDSKNMEIVALIRQGVVNGSEIARSVGLSRFAARHRIAALERDGYVTHEHLKKSTLRTTPKGDALFPEFIVRRGK